MNHLSLLRSMLILGLVASACDDQVDPSSYEGEPLVTLRGHVNTGGTSVAADVGIVWHLATQDAECQGPRIFCSSVSSVTTDPGASDCIDACNVQFPECNDVTAPQLEACYADCNATFEYLLAWETCGDVGVGARAAVDGDFPANFTLDVLDPPPPSAMMSDGDGVTAALGFIVGLDPAASNPTFAFDADAVPAIVGSVSDHALVYAPEAIPAESGWGRYLGGAYPAGFHLVALVESDPMCLDEECMHVSSGDLERLPAPAGLATELALQLGEYSTLSWPAL